MRFPSCDTCGSLTRTAVIKSSIVIERLACALDAGGMAKRAGKIATNIFLKMRDINLSSTR